MTEKVKVLFVVTSHSELGNTGHKTGWYLPEVAHPYYVFKNAGFEIDFVSPKGGAAPMDPGSGHIFKDDKICKQFILSGEIDTLTKTKKPSDIQASDYNVIFYVGGHGPMFDLADNKDIATLCTTVYENGGIVAAVCHGSVGLMPVVLTNGERIIKGQTLTGFTNAEEAAVALTNAMPFLLETKLKQLGAIFVGVDNFEPNVQVSGRIYTGQNPRSATPLAQKIVIRVKTDLKIA